MKALRLKGISDLVSANSFQGEEFLVDMNGQFNIPSREQIDLPRRVKLERVLSVQDERRRVRAAAVKPPTKSATISKKKQEAFSEASVAKTVQVTSTDHHEIDLARDEGMKPRPVGEPGCGVWDTGS
ncbi:MAG: hypothetical protein O3B13_16450 [Planctomycetota bacterium]|nr:hypothetical protein [Planctomycetota bacterium]